MSIHTYILAGGKSSRMGTAKGLVRFRNKALIQYVIEAAASVSAKIFIVTGDVAYTEFNLPLIADTQKMLGPAGAIDTILHHSTAIKNLVLACDMPFIEADSLRYLIDHSQHSQITLPLYNQYPEALFAIYNTSCKHKWHQEVEHGQLKLSHLLSHFDLNFVDGNKMCEHNKNLFCNMNTPEDLLEWE